MWSKLKAIPVVPKLVIGFMLLLVICGLSHSGAKPQTGPDFEQATYTGPEAHRSSPVRGNDRLQQTQSMLAQFQTQYAQLAQRATACMQASNMAAAQMSMQPSCVQSMPQWAAQSAYLETEIYRLQTGDTQTPMRNIVGIPESGGSSGSPSYYRPSTPDNDGGIGAVERYSRESIRGMRLYDEPDGTEHELANEPYYFRNTNSGQIVSSQLGYAPNDGAPYEQLTPQE